MKTSLAKLTLPVASLLMMPLQGCATQTTVTEARKTAEAIGHVKPSKADTCDTQRQVAAQSSKIDTLITGTETVYKPDCKPAQSATMKSS